MMRKLILFLILCNLIITPVLAQASEELSVTATVLPNASDAEVLISSSPPPSTILKENGEVVVTISYRSQESGNWPFEVVGTWEQGRIENNPSNTIDIFNYVVGSATQADEGTIPVVDPLNRKITWYIPSVSSSTAYHTVSFKLKVRNDIPTEKAIYAAIRANGKISNTLLPQQTLAFTIQKNIAPVEPTAIVTPSTPSITTAPGAPTPPSRPSDFRFGLVEIKSITDKEAEIFFQTNQRSRYILSYGTSPKSLIQQATSLSFERDHTITLRDLLPDTSYFFSIKATDEQGKSISSEIFTFRTAKGPQEVIIEKSDIAILWKNFFLTSSDVNRIVIPHNTPFTISANVKNAVNIRSIKARFRNTAVLGINTTTQSPNVGETPLIEILPGIFSGELTTPLTNGKYELLLETVESSGIFATQTVPYDFYITDPLKVIDSKSGQPIENAAIEIYRFEESVKRYTPLSNSFSFETTTNEKGELEIVLPAGRYIIQARHKLYKPTEIKVEIGITDLKLPVIRLEADRSLTNIVENIRESISSVAQYCVSAVSPLFSSTQTQPFITSLLVILLVILTIATLWEKDTKSRLKTATQKFHSYLGVLLVLSVLNLLVLISLIISIILLRDQGTIMIFLLSFATTILWLIFLRIFWKTHHS